MVNSVVLQGRLGKDIELRYTTGDKSTAVGRFSLASTRDFKSPDGNYESDWINCVVFGKTAENMEKFFKKGDMVIVTGRIQTGSYTNKEGNKVYTTDVIVNGFNFCASKKDSESASTAAKTTTSSTTPTGFMNIPEDADDELPFN